MHVLKTKISVCNQYSTEFPSTVKRSMKRLERNRMQLRPMPCIRVGPSISLGPADTMCLSAYLFPTSGTLGRYIQMPWPIRTQAIGPHNNSDLCILLLRVFLPTLWKIYAWLRTSRAEEGKISIPRLLVGFMAITKTLSRM